MQDELTNILGLLSDLRIAAGKLRNMRFIANSNIPKHFKLTNKPPREEE